jgi:hypothetical protein
VRYLREISTAMLMYSVDATQVSGMKLTRKFEIMGESFVQVSLHPSQTSHGLTEPSAITGCDWLAACQMARRTFLIINYLFKEAFICSDYTDWKPIPVSARTNAWVCGQSFPKGCGFDSRLEHGCLSVVSVVYCQISWSLLQGSPTTCSISRCDSEASTIKKPWPTTDCRAKKKRIRWNIKELVKKELTGMWNATLRRTLWQRSEFVFHD